MTDNNIVSLVQLTDRLTPSATGETLLQSITTFVKEHELLLEWDESDVELELPAADEQKMDTLTSYERDFFIIHTLLETVAEEATLDVEEENALRISEIVKTERISTAEASLKYAETTQGLGAFTPDVLEFFTKIRYASSLCWVNYVYSLRSRTNTWSGQIIIRKGMVAYTYDA